MHFIATPHPTTEDAMMNDDTRLIGLPRRALPRPVRIATATIASAVIAVVAAACSGGSGSGSPGVANVASSSASTPASPTGSVSNGPLAYSRCIRDHGLPNFPDPGGNGQPVKETPQQLGVSAAQFNEAQRTCVHLLPNTGGNQRWTPAQAQEVMNAYRNFTRCMHSHGLMNWPDPTLEIDRGDVVFDLPRGMDPDSPSISNKIQECQHVLHDVWGNTPYICGSDGRCGGGSNSAPR